MRTLIIVSFAMLFAACKPSSMTSGVKADNPPEVVALRNEGIIVWGDESSGFPDNRWDYNGRNLAPEVVQFLSNASDLNITIDRLRAHGWNRETMPKEPITKIAQIDVNPTDSVFATLENNDLGFFIDKQAFATSSEYRQQLVAQIRDFQDKRLEIEIGQRNVQEKYASRLGNCKFHLKVDSTMGIEDRRKVVQSLEAIVSQLEPQDYGVLTSIIALKNPEKATPVVGGGLGKKKSYQLYISTGDLVSGNVKQVIEAIKAYDPVALQQQQKAKYDSSSYGYKRNY